MINIIFYCNWGSNPIELLDRYKLMTLDNSGIWNNLKGTTNIDDADVVIFLEGIPKNFNLNILNKKKIICFPREPLIKKNWEVIPFLSHYTYNNFICVVTNPEFINKNYTFLKNLSYKESTKNFSAIISNKKTGLGYELRRKTLISLSKKYPYICDIYGAGWNNELGISYKGELGYYHNKNKIAVTKFNGLIDYKYSLCIENCSIKNYFTEKITDALLCWTIPVYYGCTNIQDYFPKDSYYWVDITKPNCLDKIIEIVNKPITEKNIEALKQARDLILNKYNIWSFIEKML
jgi:hypothetical protein